MSNATIGASAVTAEKETSFGMKPTPQSPRYNDIILGDVESVERYRPGGYHPIILGDLLGGRYETIAKLGCGGFSTVWLCWDEQEMTWQAVKVLSANASSRNLPELVLRDRLWQSDPSAHHITLPTHSFWIEGPNGRHICLVLPVLGPSIMASLFKGAHVQKRALFQVACGLSYLHRHGIAHGDLTPDNVLFHLPNLDHISKDQMKTLLSEPHICNVHAREQQHRHQAPKYLVATQHINIEPSNNITLVDLGVGFDIFAAPTYASIPWRFRPPEALLEIEIGPSLDIWAFACMILEVRHDEVPFVGSNLVGVVASLEVSLGPLPEPYRTPFRKLHPEEVTDEDDEKSTDTLETVTYWGSIWEERDLLEQCSGYSDPLEGKVRKPLEEETLPKNPDGSWNYDEEYIVTKHSIPEEEVPQLLDLLRNCFKYDPSQRLTLKEIMAHPWFDGHRESAISISQKRNSQFLKFGSSGLCLSWRLPMWLGLGGLILARYMYPGGLTNWNFGHQRKLLASCVHKASIGITTLLLPGATWAMMRYAT